MGSKLLLQTAVRSFAELVGNGIIYTVPIYQRNYSWNKEQWENLWEDVWDAKAGAINNDPHYMGAIVIQGTGKNFTIIDGQQRIVTLSIIAIAAIQSIQDFVKQGVEKEENTKRIELLKNSYISTKDPASLNDSSKLELNSTDNPFYQSKLVNFNPPFKPGALTGSNALLWDAFCYFHTKIKEMKKSGGEIARFFVELADKLEFIAITVQDESGAYTIFETLNARMLELTPADLLKNLLFSKVTTQADLKMIQHQWLNIADKVGLKDIPTFLRHFLNSQKELVRKDRLFKELKNKVKNSEDVFILLKEMDDTAYVYSALDNPSSTMWTDVQRQYVEELNLFKVSQYKPLILSAYKIFDEQGLAKILHAIAVISFRYQIIAGLNPNDLEKVYSDMAVAIHTKKICSAQEAIVSFKDVYVQDGDFKQAFSSKVITRNPRLTKYILCRLEAQRQGIRDLDQRSSNVTIEHILSENPGEMPDGVSLENHAANVYRLGNYALLEAGLNNKDAANKPFEQKKEVYKKSQYKITRELAEFETWTQSEIKKRQDDLAKTATAIWRIDF